MDRGRARSLEKAWENRSAIPPLKETQKSGARFSWRARLEAWPSPGTVSCQSDQVGVMCQVKSRLAWRGILQ